MLNYEVKIEGVKIDGHPIVNYSTDLTIACKFYDDMVKKYPFNEVILSETVKVLIKKSKPLKKPKPKCPHGCDKISNGRHNLQQGSKGYFCTICGWREPNLL